jgi:hypothetical protein
MMIKIPAAYTEEIDDARAAVSGLTGQLKPEMKIPPGFLKFFRGRTPAKTRALKEPGRALPSSHSH